MPGAHIVFPKQSGASRSAVQEVGRRRQHLFGRIGLEYRALAVMRRDRIVWYWIGNHAEYDRLV